MNKLSLKDLESIKLEFVFWSAPHLREPDKFIKFFEKHRDVVLREFIANGRMIDTLKLFSIEEIQEGLERFERQIPKRRRELWKNFLDAYLNR